MNSRPGKSQQMKATRHRIHGLDTLRASAIILVFIFHYLVVTGKTIFGSLSEIGWVGVDLFFVLSGYLIGNQIFQGIMQQNFSLKNFYYRRFLRTLPNYLFVLAIYFLVPAFRDKPLVTPLWKFLTFTQNVNLQGGAFSHAWSLCLEEQFYFVIPILALYLAHLKWPLRRCWLLIGSIIMAGMIIRSLLWLCYIQHAGVEPTKIYIAVIYYASYCRLDGLLFGISIALLRNYYPVIWQRATGYGNLFLCCGLVSCYLTIKPFHEIYAFLPTTFSYLLQSASFALLVLAALSSNSLLSKTKVPGAAWLASWSYAIYLTHKQLIHLTQTVLAHYLVNVSDLFSMCLSVMICIIGGGILYTCIEVPFLNLRDKRSVFTKQSNSTNKIPATAMTTTQTI